LSASDAVFVRTGNVDTPMGGGLLAFAERARAERAASKFAGAVHTPPEIGLP
jgi:hypothetical protein